MSQTVTLGDLLKDYEEQRELTVVGAGEYDVEIMGKPTVKGLQVTPVYKIISGPYEGQRMMAGIFGTFNGNGGGIFVRNLLGAGLTKEWLASLGAAEEAVKVIAEALKGRKLKITVNVEPYNGEDRNTLQPGSVRLLESDTELEDTGRSQRPVSAAPEPCPQHPPETPNYGFCEHPSIPYG